MSWTDLDPILVPPFGTKPFFYRVQVVDAYGIVGAPSAVISGTVPDTTPPGPTAIIDAVGAPDHIRVDWRPNSEPDLAGYQVYRGVCDLGIISSQASPTTRPRTERSSLAAKADSPAT